MQAVVLSDRGVGFEPDYPFPEPGVHEILVRVLRAGICETDLQLVRGYMGFRGVLGHEFVGIAEDGPLRGERVVAEINCSCHRCRLCRDGLSNHCPHRSVLGILNHDGAFAEYVAVPRRNVHWVPDRVTTDQAVFVEPLAAAFEILRQVPVRDVQRAIVLGDGRLGNLCAQVLRNAGCRVLVVGKHTPKLDLLRRLDIETARLDEVEPDRSAELVVDCTGSASGWETAMRFLRPRGTLVLKTTIADRQQLHLAPLVIDEITVVGSRCGPFPDALEALERGEVTVEPLINARFPLAEAERAFQTATRADTLKVLFDVADGPKQPPEPS
ncbi:MAG: alcohol dehydrogenase [Planctomycetota bacterium]|nr:MAG: alcohol dehydrogenase [Planctomycetota bacterium]